LKIPYLKKLGIKRDAMFRVLLRGLEDSKNHIVAKLVADYIFEYVEVLEKKLVEV
jgi:hypothetical protein